MTMSANSAVQTATPISTARCEGPASPAPSGMSDIGVPFGVDLPALQDRASGASAAQECGA
jgi:hypothetical protein